MDHHIKHQKGEELQALWLLVQGGLDCVFLLLLVSWKFHLQQSLEIMRVQSLHWFNSKWKEKNSRGWRTVRFQWVCGHDDLRFLFLLTAVEPDMPFCHYNSSTSSFDVLYILLFCSTKNSSSAIWVTVDFYRLLWWVWSFSSELSQQGVSDYRTFPHRMLFSMLCIPFCVNSRDFVWKSQEINSSWLWASSLPPPTMLWLFYSLCFSHMIGWLDSCINLLMYLLKWTVSVYSSISIVIFHMSLCLLCVHVYDNFFFGLSTKEILMLI